MLCETMSCERLVTSYVRRQREPYLPYWIMPREKSGGGVVFGPLVQLKGSLNALAYQL